MRNVKGSIYLAASAVAAGNGSALAGRGRLVVLLDILRRWGLLAVGVLRRRGARPLVGARKTVLLLILWVLVGGHVRARLLGRRREGRVHLGGAASAGGQAAYGSNEVGQEGARGVAHLLTGHDSERARVTMNVCRLHGSNHLRARAAADRRRWQAAARQAAASGRASGLGHPGEG